MTVTRHWRAARHEHTVAMKRTIGLCVLFFPITLLADARSGEFFGSKIGDRCAVTRSTTGTDTLARPRFGVGCREPEKPDKITSTVRMELLAFQSLVRANAEWFRGVNPESHPSLDRVESQLGCPLPDSLKWLLTEYGYSGACGISSLELAVTATLRCRITIPLRQPYVILNDWGDAGVVCLDSRSGPVIWTQAHDLPRLAAGLALRDADIFEDFPTWVVSRLEVEKMEA